MFRLKDYTALIAKFKPQSHVTIVDHNGHDIDYNDIIKYIDLLVDKLDFIDMLEGEYSCFVKLSKKSGTHTTARRAIQFYEILNCLSGTDAILMPCNALTKEIYWDWANDAVVEKMCVSNIIPLFSARHVMLQVYLL